MHENVKKEQKATDAVIAYEAKCGRMAEKIPQGEGYDVYSEGKDEERHIEIKRRKKFPPYIRLNYNQTKLLLNDQKFWLYIVYPTEDGDLVVIPIPREELLNQQIRMVVEASIRFPKPFRERMIEHGY
jgi:hypothetical protein